MFGLGWTIVGLAWRGLGLAVVAVRIVLSRKAGRVEGTVTRRWCVGQVAVLVVVIISDARMSGTVVLFFKREEAIVSVGRLVGRPLVTHSVACHIGDVQRA